LTDAQWAAIVMAALGLGAAAMKALQMVLSRRNGPKERLTAAEWKRELVDASEEGTGRAFRGRDEQIREIFESSIAPLLSTQKDILVAQAVLLEKLNQAILEIVKLNKQRGA
jgi:hypothetical protein